MLWQFTFPVTSPVRWFSQTVSSSWNSCYIQLAVVGELLPPQVTAAYCPISPQPPNAPGWPAAAAAFKALLYFLKAAASSAATAAPHRLQEEEEEGLACPALHGGLVYPSPFTLFNLMAKCKKKQFKKMEVQGEFYFGLRPEIFHKREIFSRWSIITKKHQPFIWYQMRKRICGGVAATRNQFFLAQPASHWTALAPLSIDTALCDPVQQSQCQNFPVFFSPRDHLLFCFEEQLRPVSV